MNDKVKDKKNCFDQVIECLSPKIYSVFKKIPNHYKESIFEIRIRSLKPIILRTSSDNMFISSEGQILNQISNKALYASQSDVTESFNKICEYSIYSHQEEIKNGFITFRGGHRIGICGTAVKKNDSLSTIKNISSLNIRISREIFGSANNLLKNLSTKNFGFLIVGPPSSGKTTLLRDLARVMSCELNKCVTIVDERCEIAATYNGIASNDIGLCDVMNQYPKGYGIIQAIRTMSPEIIICDEIGETSEVEAVRQGLNAGVHVIASIHADSLEDFLSRPQAINLIKTHAFKKLVFLSKDKPGQINKIIGVDELDIKDNRVSYNYSFRNGNRFRLCSQTYSSSKLS